MKKSSRLSTADGMGIVWAAHFRLAVPVVGGVNRKTEVLPQMSGYATYRDLTWDCDKTSVTSLSREVKSSASTGVDTGVTTGILHLCNNLSAL
jgi:hypothetical protein